MALLFGRSASASNPIIDGTPQDLWFAYTEPAVLAVRTFAVQGFGSDPMLWLYDSDGRLLAANDDWFGLQSFIELQVTPGSYRLRAGFCCGDPNATRPGQRYEVGSSVAPVLTTVETSTSSQESTTTMVDSSSLSTTTVQERSTTTTSSVPESTTTQETTTTIQNVVPSTSDPVPSSSDLPTTTLPQTTLQESTSTSDASSTTLPETTEPVSETILTSTSVNVSTSTVDVTTTLTTMPPRPQATTPPQTSTTTPTMPPVTSTSETPLTTTPPETLETTTTTAPGEMLTNILTTPDAVVDAVAQADTPTERAALTAELNNASDTVKETFEATVNVYSGEWDSYVPAGSRIPVGERRTLIAVMGGLVSLASTAPRRKN